jgi:putative ABC transport system substrate-binding protein
MRRREFITLAGGMAVWPLAARAQQSGQSPGEHVRRIGVVENFVDDAEGQTRISTFVQALEQLGWTEDRNVRTDIRWTAGDIKLGHRYAAELVALTPDVILASSAPVVEALQQATSTIPIVFVTVTDPVGAGLVASLARPGGNTTGFSLFEYGISAKWLELLKEIAPRVMRAAILRDPTVAVGIGQLGAMQSVAPSLGMELFPIDVRDPRETERAVTAFARASSNGGLIVLPNPLVVVRRKLIVTLAARYELPAVYSSAYLVREGGLISYGPDVRDQYRRAAGYVDRILKGEKPAELPVQAPAKYELVINRKTAKVLGLDVPPTLLARADEVIE